MTQFKHYHFIRNDANYPKMFSNTWDTWELSIFSIVLSPALRMKTVQWKLTSRCVTALSAVIGRNKLSINFSSACLYFTFSSPVLGPVPPLALGLVNILTSLIGLTNPRTVWEEFGITEANQSKGGGMCRNTGAERITAPRGRLLWLEHVIDPCHVWDWC